MSSRTSESGQPHKVYTYPLDVVLLVRDQLGVAQGFVEFAHIFKYADNIHDLVKTLMEYKRQGILVNEFTKEEIKTEIMLDVVQNMTQIYEGQTYLVKTFDEEQTTVKIYEEIVLQRPNSNKDNMLKSNQTYEELPALQSLKPLRDNYDKEFLIEIAEAILERLAYEGENPKALTVYGNCVDPETNLPYFKTVNDIEESYHYTKKVSHNYYDNTKKRLWRKWKDLSIRLKTNMVAIAKEMQGFDYERSETVEDVTKLE